MTALVAAYRRRRFAWLFGTLLVTLGLGPTLETMAPSYNPLQLLLGLNLLAAIASVVTEGHVRVPLLLAGGFAVARVLQAGLGVPGMLPVGDGLWFVALALATVVTLRYALAAGRVDTEHVLAALDAYLLVGILFAFAYWTIDQAWPASFRGTPSGLGQLDGIYFSFITIATLGYGDVVPASPPARGLAIVEAVSGQMYLAVLVARLVTLYSQQRDD